MIIKYKKTIENRVLVRGLSERKDPISLRMFLLSILPGHIFVKNFFSFIYYIFLYYYPEIIVTMQ